MGHLDRLQPLSRRLADERFGADPRRQDLEGLAANPRMLSFIAELDDLRNWSKPATSKARSPRPSCISCCWTRWQYEYERLQPKGAKGRVPTLTKEDLWAAVRAVAVRLWHKLERTVEYGELEDEASRVCQRITEMTRAEAAYQVGVGALFIKDDEGRFSFVHQSIPEWLVADAAATASRRSRTFAQRC